MSLQEELNSEDGVVEINSAWDNFVKSKDGTCATCKTCDKSFKTTGGNTSGLHYHLKTHKIVAKKVRKRKRHDGTDLDVASTSLPNSRIKAGKSYLATEQSIMGIIARLTAKRGLSFRLFEDEDIKACINALMFMLKRSERMPSSDKTIRSYVVKYFQRVKEAVIMSIQQLKSKGTKFSLVIDEWTSIANRRYMNATLFGNNNLFWSLGLIKITGSATAERLMELLLERLESFQVNYNDDIIGITTDGAATMVKLGRDESTAQHQLCLIHGIHLAVVDVLYENRRCCIVDPIQENPLDSSYDDTVSTQDTECLEGFTIIETEEQVVLKDLTIKDTIGKIRQLGRFFKKSPPNNEKLQAYVKDKFNSVESKMLLVDCKTRWNSLYAMLERYLEIEDCVDKVIIDIRSDIIITKQEKYIIECIVKTLKPVEAVIKDLSSRNCHLHQAFVSLKWLFTELQKNDNPLTNKFAKRLYIRMKTRFNINYKVMRYLSTASFSNIIPAKPAMTPEEIQKQRENTLYHFESYLDLSESEQLDSDDVQESYSTYFKLFDVPSKKDIRNHMLTIIKLLFNPEDETVVPAVAEEVPVASKRSFTDELRELLASEEILTTDHQDSSDISKKLQAEMVHFEKAKERTGYLIKMYDAMLTVKSSSVESERCFSQAAQICTKFRSRLGDDTIDALSFLRSFFANPVIYND